MKGILKTIFTTAVCAALFLSASLFYMEISSKKTEEAEAKNDNVPYYESTPDDCGVLIEFPDETGCVVYFDFSKTGITAIFTDDVSNVGKSFRGYSVDYTLCADYELLSGIIDRSGGIDLNIKNELLRYTGVQIIDLLAGIGDPTSIRASIAKAIFKSISENGVTKEDIVYIIENSETDLSVPICLSWPEHLKDMCKNASVIN